MKQISELKSILGQYFTWNKARFDCFVRLLLAMFATRTVNLSEIATVMASKATIASRYKRLQRFFAQVHFDYDLIAKFIYALFFHDKKIYLLIDRTNWCWGKSKINILTLAIAYEGAAIPIFWRILKTKGNASAEQHQVLLERFIRVFGQSQIHGVLGDREFASGALFKFFNQHKIPFFIRIKDGSQITIKGKKLMKAKQPFSHLQPGERCEYAMVVELYKQKVWLAGSRSERGELMVVATNQNADRAIATYLRRWEIETLFSCLKTRGFCFEKTNLTEPERLCKLMAVLAIGFCWAHKVGQWRAQTKPIRWAKHRDGRRPQSSFFRYGFDFIRDLILNPYACLLSFKRSARFLRPNTQRVADIL